MPDPVISNDYLTVKEVAALLRVTERKVYDLASSGQVPCSKATGKLLFPEAQLRQWIAAAQTGPETSSSFAGLRPQVLLGSHDPLLDWAIRQSDSGLATIFDASLDGLRRFQRGEGVAAGLHLQHSDGSWNRTAVSDALSDQNVVLVRWCLRARGFAVRAEHANHLGDIQMLSKLRIAPRQTGSGSEVLLRKALRDAGVDIDAVEFVRPCKSEQDALLAVVQGEADVAFGLQSLAEPYGLIFRSVVTEPYDIVLDRKAWFDPPLRVLFEFARSDEFAGHVRLMPGTSTEELGRVIWNA